MDGNGRWARKRGLPRLEGHRQGYKALKRVLMAAADLEVQALTAYGFSSENWTRSEDEVSGLMKLIQFAAQAELNDLKKQGVRFLVSGRTAQLPDSVRNQLLENVESTRGNSRIILNLAINYGGRNEIVDAAREAARMVAEGRMGIDDIDESVLSGLMYQPDLPDPDLLIRTAGEMRISNFLLWESAYTELYITDTLWPDFSGEELAKAIGGYQGRTRKFGTVIEEGQD